MHLQRGPGRTAPYKQAREDESSQWFIILSPNSISNIKHEMCWDCTLLRYPMMLWTEAPKILSMLLTWGRVSNYLINNDFKKHKHFVYFFKTCLCSNYWMRITPSKICIHNASDYTRISYEKLNPMFNDRGHHFTALVFLFPFPSSFARFLLPSAHLPRGIKRPLFSAWSTDRK